MGPKKRKLVRLGFAAVEPMVVRDEVEPISYVAVSHTMVSDDATARPRSVTKLSFAIDGFCYSVRTEPQGHVGRRYLDYPPPTHAYTQR